MMTNKYYDEEYFSKFEILIRVSGTRRVYDRHQLMKLTLERMRRRKV